MQELIGEPCIFYVHLKSNTLSHLWELLGMGLNINWHTYCFSQITWHWHRALYRCVLEQMWFQQSDKVEDFIPTESMLNFCHRGVTISAITFRAWVWPGRCPKVALTTYATLRCTHEITRSAVAASTSGHLLSTSVSHSHSHGHVRVHNHIHIQLLFSNMHDLPKVCAQEVPLHDDDCSPDLLPPQQSTAMSENLPCFSLAYLGFHPVSFGHKWHSSQFGITHFPEI